MGRIFSVPFSSVYPLYVTKVEKKERPVRTPAVSAVLIGGALLVILSGCVPGWDKSSFTLEDALVHRDDASVVANAKEDTEALCAGVTGCIEGWTSDQADYVRFESNAEAEDYASTLGDDGYHSNRVVIDFTRAQPVADTRQAVIEGIDGIHSSE